MRNQKTHRKIYISESKIPFMFEGMDLSVGNDGNMYASINNDMTDKGNKNVDTRLFGTRNNILYGDGSTNDRSIEAKVTAFKRNMEMWYKVYMFIKSNPKIDFSQLDNRYLSKILGVDLSTLNGRMVNAIMNTFARESYDDMITNALNNYNKTKKEYTFLNGMYNRTFNDGSEFKKSNGEIVKPRYYIGKVPNTDVDVISVFTMNSFDLSDIMKHGQMRQSKTTDSMLGIDSSERAKKKYSFPKRRGSAENGKLDVSYDDGSFPTNVENNFSYDDSSFDDSGKLIDNDHFGRKHMDSSNYSSMAQFVDKSIMGAALALRNEGIKPNFIVAAPSSSKFNVYYCNRLSNKINVEFVNGFFQRNVINAVLDEDAMIKGGIDEDTIKQIKLQIEGFALKEIVGIVTKPIDDYITTNDALINLDKKYGIRGRKGKYNVLTTNVSSFTNVIKGAIITILLSNGMIKEKDELGSYIKDQMSMFNNNTEVNAFGMSYNSIIRQLSMILPNDPRFKECIYAVNNLVNKYADKLKNGFKPTLIEAKKFKITNFEFKHRQFLKNVYIIADKEFNKNYQLLKRYSNAKFLLFDEDINSGATLKLLIDAMNMHGIPNSKITCLVNSYYLNG